MKITLLTWALSLFLYVTLAHSKEDMYLVTKVDGQTKKLTLMMNLIRKFLSIIVMSKS